MGAVLDAFRRDHPGRDLDLGGVRLHYLDEGSGPPVVMVHGNPTWSFYYRRLVEALRGSHRTIVPDHVGCGFSDKPDDSQYEYTLSRRVADLEALLDHLGLDGGLTLVLHDWGGMIGMAYAAKYPERIARLVILNTAAFHLPASKPFPRPLWACRDMPLNAWIVCGLNAFCRVAARVCCTHHPMPRSVREAYLAPYDSWAHRIAIHRFVQDIPLRPGDRAYDLVTRTQDRLHLLSDVPMLIAWGMRDFVFDHHFLSEWVRRFPEAEVHRFPKGGHYILEDEAESVIPLVCDFLAAHPAADPHPGPLPEGEGGIDPAGDGSSQATPRRTLSRRERQELIRSPLPPGEG